jgi:hypothetical protein
MCVDLQRQHGCVSVICADKSAHEYLVRILPYRFLLHAHKYISAFSFSATTPFFCSFYTERAQTTDARKSRFFCNHVSIKKKV